MDIFEYHQETKMKIGRESHLNFRALMKRIIKKSLAYVLQKCATCLCHLFGTEQKNMKEIIVVREIDQANFEIVKENGKYIILRHKVFSTGEVTKERAYFQNIAIYGDEEFENVVQAYKYLKEWIDWFY